MYQFECSIAEGLWRALETLTTATHEPAAETLSRALTAYFGTVTTSSIKSRLQPHLLRADTKAPCESRTCVSTATLAWVRSKHWRRSISAH